MSNTTSSKKCAFKNALISNDYQCENASRVSNRNGPDIDCQSNKSSVRCNELFEKLKAAALPAMDLEDDLLTMPASALMKIQLGGLSAMAEQSSTTSAPADNINEFIVNLQSESDDWNNIGFDDIATKIKQFKLKRRRSNQ